MHSQHTFIQRMIGRQSGKSEQCTSGRHISFFNKGSQFTLCISEFYPLSYQYKRTFGIIYQFGGFLHRIFIGIRHRNITTYKIQLRRLVFCLCILCIFGEVQYYRTGTTATGNIECTCHRPSYIFCTANLITPFSDRLGDTYQVDFLKSVCSEKTRPYLSGNNYDRCTVYHCIGNTGDCIRCSGTACHQTNTYLTRYAGKTLRCMSSSLFVANQDMVQCILMIVQSIEYRHDRTSGITEDSSHSLMFQGTHQCFRTCY